MKGKKKNIMTYIACLCMIASMFPVFGVWAEGGGHGRDAHIVVTDITVWPSQDVVNGIYRNGNYRLNVSFELTDNVNLVNVTWNVTHIDTNTSEINTTHLGNLTAGNHFSNDTNTFDFTVEGEYLINATVWGNYSSANISTSLDERLNFSNQARYELKFEVSVGSQAETGEYANNTLVTISGNVSNQGNYDIQHTNITVNITAPVGFVEGDQPWNNPFGLLRVNESIDNVQFNWLPTMEGDYDVNITAMDVATNQSNSTNFTMTVKDIVDINVGEIQHDDSYVKGEEFEITVFLNNTGNAEMDAVVNLTIVNETQVSVYTAELMDEILPGVLKIPVKFFNIVIQEPGIHTVQISAEGSENQSTLTIQPIPPTPPVLVGEVFDPNPYEVVVYEGDIITFYVNYSDRNDDAGSVTLVLDDIEYEMVLSDGVGDAWDTVETFKYEWTAIEGTTHNFYFNFTDGLYDETYRPLYDNFTVLPPVMGMLYGKVTDERTGANISGAEIVLYSTVLNATNVTKIDAYDNLTADENGSYEKVLSFSDNKYVLFVNEDWMEANEYKSPTPAIDNFWMNLNNQVVWKNFTVESKEPPKPKTWLNGTVNNTEGVNLSDVKIIVEIFTDEPKGKMIVQKEINGTMENVSVDVTNRTWTNMTNITVNGSYSIEGVPFGIPEGLPVTGTKTFRLDLETPRDVSEGWWYVNVSKDGYVSQETMFQFKDGETTFGNFTLLPPVVVKEKATITGKITPPDAKITGVPADKVDLDTSTGNFTISDIDDGDYNLTFNATGYVDKTLPVSIINGEDYKMGEITLVNWTPGADTDQVTIGPFMDGEDFVTGITVYFTLNGIEYSNATGSDGNAEFLLTGFTAIPDGTEITLSKMVGDATEIVTRTYPLTEDDLTTIFTETDDKEDEEESSIGGLILIILGVVAIIIVIVVILMMRSKTKEEELFEDEMREYECPGCGAIVNAGMDACPECGEAFEVEEFRCPECSEEIEKDATMCDSCGAEFEMPEKVEEGEEEEEEEGEEEVPDEPEAIEDFDVEEEDEEIEGIEEAAEELEEETPPPMEEDELDDLDDDLEDLDDDLDDDLDLEDL